MRSNLQSVNIGDYIRNNEYYFLEKIFQNFSIPQNKEVENFIKNNAIQSYLLGQSSTYLLFNNDIVPQCVGYFTLAIKPANVPDNMATNKIRKKLKRVTSIDEKNKSYLHASYLVAQLGKNYAIDKSKQIAGRELLKIVEDTIVELKNRVGGISCFVECEDNEFLKNFYEKNNYLYFDKRYGDGIKYLQLMKLI